jgi:hypothetical protein
MSQRRIFVVVATGLLGSIGILGASRVSAEPGDAAAVVDAATVGVVEPAVEPAAGRSPAVVLPEAAPIEPAPDGRSPRPLTDRGVPAFSGSRSRGAEAPTPGGPPWWRLIVAGLYVAMVIGFRFFEAWRRER